MEKILATKDDISLLQNEMRKNQYGLWFTTFGSFLFTFCFIFGKKRGNSIYENHGFFVPFGILFPTFFAIFHFSNLKEKRKFEKDLKVGYKIIEIIKIVDKDTNMKNEYLITLDITNPKLSKHKIEEGQFKKLKIGDFVKIEYFEESQTFLRVEYLF